MSAEQLAQTEQEFAPFIGQGFGQSLDAQRILLGLGATDPNARRRQEIADEISTLESEQGDSKSQFGGIVNARTGELGFGGAGGAIGKLMRKVSSQTAESSRNRSSRLDELRAELEGFGQAPQGTAQEQQAQAFQRFQESPGQKFIRDRAQRSLTRNASAIGGLGGGNIRSALVEQGTGFAQQDFQNQFNRLGVTSAGEQAVTGRQQQAATNLANIRAGFGAQQGAALIGAGQAKSSGLTGQAAGLRGGIQQVGSAVAGGMTGGASGVLSGFLGI